MRVSFDIPEYTGDVTALGTIRILEAIRETRLKTKFYQAGSSEMRNWIALAGALEDTGLKMKLVDYVPCYRSTAGTGNAMGFVEWS